jgi:hypothetical protein
MDIQAFDADPNGIDRFGGVPGARHFAALQDGETIGRVSTFHPPSLHDEGGRPVGCLGFFRCIDEYAVAEALLHAAVEELRRRQADAAIWGPIDFDIWDAYRFKRTGFGNESFLGEPSNPPHYPRFFERFGFVVRKSWRSTEVRGRDVLEAVVARLEPRHRRAVRSGYRLRRFDSQDPDDFRTFHELLSRSYERFLGYTAIGLDRFERSFAMQLRAMDPRFLTLAYDPNGRAAGFAIAFPDRDRVVFHTLGITPEELRTRGGLGSALCVHLVRTALDAGFEAILAALVADDSLVHRIVGAAAGSPESEYALYELPS